MLRALRPVVLRNPSLNRAFNTNVRKTYPVSSILPDAQLDSAIERVEKIIESNQVNSRRDLIRLRDSDAELRRLLSEIEGKNDQFLQRHLLFDQVTAPKNLKAPVRVVVTGASGAIGYAIAFRIASGQMLGPDQPVHLSLLELPQALKSLQGVVMELNDCAFPLLSGITATDKVDEAFDGVQYALLVGAKPRSKGMERADLLKGNAAIFQVQGKALNERADKESLKVVVVGNPANTNALIAARNAPSIDPRRFSALTRLDHNRGLAQLALKTGRSINDIKRFAIWGNHSATQYPDVSHTQIDDVWAKKWLPEEWIQNDFIPTVQQRGAAIINARGSSSAFSAASSAIDHIRDWENGSHGEWTSMAVYSDGSYGATKGLYFSFPVVCENGDYSIVQNVPIDPFSAERIEKSHQELLQERDAVAEYLPKH
eukprot:TRINITY_DN101_c0_g2_i1.p1 TRINITY_DN101_c0_g2~~TRINITY_DN101_c0_g2_i1.p1  ORF type:complete len:428 (-),score=99.51 TRINITY_DN101_c0_g2_i1:67-1350(-)